MNEAACKTRSFLQFLGTLLLGMSVTGNTAVAATPDFGPNVLIFDPSMSTSQIQTAVNAIAAQQVSNQFGTQRYSLFFKPGTYGSATAPLNFQVGFYTEVAGLGASPDDVVINGSIYVRNQCDSNGCTALDNFWRSLSNLSIHVTTPGFGCYSGEFWAVSQAAPLRRVHIIGNTTFMDYCTGPSYASGGFMADSVASTITNGSQQQFYVRNSVMTKWSNAVWNQVFSGVIGAPVQSYPTPPYTTLPTTPVSREKPYLYIDTSGNYNVFAPSARMASSGTSWSTGTTAGRSIPISKFLIANPATSVNEINDALEDGRNLILTPGIYKYSRPIEIQRPNTVVLALGDATLVPQEGNAAITIADAPGVQAAGFIVDAGPERSAVLFQIGRRREGDGDNRDRDDEERDGSDALQHTAVPPNPITLNDVFFRIGGATIGSATTSLEVNSNNVLLDDLWAWRADHGAGAAWTVNQADHGLVVNGDNVTATGLFVEHFQKEQVLWNGNGGETIFYQSELPYDPPSQSAWMDEGANGYPSYEVTRHVKTHQAYGLGIYSFFNQGINIIEDNAMIVPDVSGVSIHDAGTVFLNGSGQITHVTDGVGATVSKANAGTLSPVVVYP